MPPPRRIHLTHSFKRSRYLQGGRALRNLVRGGVSEVVAMRLSSHRTRSVFHQYDIVSTDDLRDAVRKLGRA